MILHFVNLNLVQNLYEGDSWRRLPDTPILGLIRTHFILLQCCRA